MESISFYFEWEVALQAWIQSFMGSFGTAVMSFLTLFGEEVMLIGILGYIYWCYDKEFGKFIGNNVVVGIVLNPLLKNLALRRRPYFDHPNIKCLKPVHADADIYDIAAQGYSFPSGHSMNSAVIYGSLPMYKKKSRVLRILAFLMPFLVGLSRVALGVHYVTDVLMGWALGAGLVLVFSFLQRKVKNIHLLHAIIFLVSLSGLFYCQTTDYFTGLGLMGGFFLAAPFEEKFVRFENTRSILGSILRVLVGAALYFGINTLLKLPFSSEFLESATMAAYLVRALRYLVVGFVLMGLYPMIFGRISALKRLP